MKRLLFLALPILALTAFAACSSGDSTSATKTAGASTTSAPSTTAAHSATPAVSGSSASNVQDIENTVTQLGATTAADIDFFIAHTTTNFISQSSVYSDEASCRANAAACIGPASTVSNFTNTTVTGDTATTTALFTSGTATQTLELQLVRENGVWKVNSAQPVASGAASPTG